MVANAASAAAMIEGCFAVAAEVFQLLTESFDVPLERLQLKDADGSGRCDHIESGGEVGGVALLDGFSRNLRSFTGLLICTSHNASCRFI